MFQIGHISLTSADTYRRDSYCLARVFQNLPTPPKQYGVFDVFAIFKVFSNLKTWGRTWKCAPMADFYRKVNKFFQKFAKCDPCPKEVELRSRRGKFIYNRSYNSIGLNQVSQLYSWQDKLP